ncbi:uncharacterized protein LOC117298281 [Asterias rubens]|uniref:uncharacterized protein LOC117298281 n=1 Tax=Asterias rubens TaxID=7604 RepID=UPI00145587E1|nr:uncharacterized protein LOC117298281 [Asterias rubens]XP_033637323.1 uncharacterized protein LOC117298281 [Asterias rubens]XP_033637324.1 uncharacterized protein LOC117298281 [Asterias rubens]
MATQEREKAAKRRLNGFLADALEVGCVKGFKYFKMYMRGREELICCIKNELTINVSSCSPLNSKFTFNSSGGFTSDHLPINQQELMLSQNTQQKLSGYGFMDIGLPPASPSDNETGPEDSKSTMFLIAGYSRYSCPYVWVRSNHERLVKRSDDHGPTTRYSKDSPLKLKSTSAWQEKDIKVWDIIAELVKLCTLPSPRNPFALDMEYFDALPLQERIIALGAMSHFMQNVLNNGPDKSYSGLVSDDLREITKRHFTDFQMFLQ